VTASATAKAAPFSSRLFVLRGATVRVVATIARTSQHGCDVGYGWGHVSGTPVDATIVIQIGPLPKSN
jgi:hypothetical protein